MGFEKLHLFNNKFQSTRSIGIHMNKFDVIRNARVANRVYERASNPMSIAEITETHFPNIIQSNFVINGTINTLSSQMPFIYEIHDLCNKVSTSKELCEGAVQIIKKKCLQQNNYKKKVLYAVKIYIILYKTIWLILEHNGIPKDHNTITIVLDYLNFLLAHF